MILNLKSATGIISRLRARNPESRYCGDSCNLKVTGNLGFRIGGVDFEIYTSHSGEVWLNVEGVDPLLHYDPKLGLSPGPLLEDIQYSHGVTTMRYAITYLEESYGIVLRLEDDGLLEPRIDTLVVSVREIGEEEEEEEEE